MRKFRLPILYSIWLVLFAVTMSTAALGELKKTESGLYYCTKSEGKVDPAIVAKLKYDLVESEKVQTERIGEAIMLVFKVKDENKGYLPKDVKDLFMTTALYPSMTLDQDTLPFFVVIGITEVYNDDSIGFFGFQISEKDRDKAYYKRMESEDDLKKT